MATFTVISKRAGGGSGTVSIGLAGEAVEIWIVLADDVIYTTEDVRGSGMFPAVYESYHEQNSRLLLMPIEIVQHEDAPNLFTCTLKWTSEPLTNRQQEEQDDNPLDRKPRIRIKTIREREVRHRDFYGKPKVNKAGDLFDPPIESPTAFLQVIIRKNVTFFEDWVFDYINAVNSVDFTISGRTKTRTIKAFTACIADIDLGEEQTDGDTVYCECVIEMHVKKPRKPVSGELLSAVPGPWQTEQLNEGLHELTDKYPGTASTDKVHKRIMVGEPGETPQPAASPVLLNSTGGKLDPVTVDNATFVVFDDHEYLDFNDISYLWSNT